MATNSVELTPAFTGPTRRISGSFSPATWHSSSTMARRCRCLPAMSSLRTELATVGAWLGTCRPPWLLSSSEPSAVRIRPAREVTIAVTREDRCGYSHPRLAKRYLPPRPSLNGRAGAVESSRGALRSHHNGAHRRTAGRGEVVIAVEASPVSQYDLMMISGNYGYRRYLSANMGTEGVGRAIAVGNAPNDAVEQALSKTSLAELRSEERRVGKEC